MQETIKRSQCKRTKKHKRNNSTTLNINEIANYKFSTPSKVTKNIENSKFCFDYASTASNNNNLFECNKIQNDNFNCARLNKNSQ